RHTRFSRDWSSDVCSSDLFVSNLKPEIVELAKKIEVKVKPYHERVDETAFFNQQKVLAAFRKHQVSDFHLNPSTGYGYDDEGREIGRASCRERVEYVGVDG